MGESMAETPNPLHIINGGRHAERPWRRRSLNEAEQITCPECEKRMGVATSRFRKVTLAPRRKPDGSVSGGTSVWVCDLCGWQV